MLKRMENQLNDLYYDVRAVFKPHNIVKCVNLPRTWVESDNLMFHCMFQIVVDFVELQQPFKMMGSPPVKRHTNRQEMEDYLKYAYDDKENYSQHYENMREILFLYGWYCEGHYDRRLTDAYYSLPIEQILEEDAAHNVLCESMLQRILKIRDSLWT